MQSDLNIVQFLSVFSNFRNYMFDQMILAFFQLTAYVPLIKVNFNVCYFLKKSNKLDISSESVVY